MKIVNVLFARTKGGLEQVFLDYGRALSGEGHEVHMVCQPDCPYLDVLTSLPVTTHVVANGGEWDIGSWLLLNQLLTQIKPDLIIGHGNRALSILRPPLPFLKARFPVFGVAQNYKLKRFSRLDGAFASTRELLGILQTKHGLKSVFHIPNMVSLPKDAVERPRRFAVPVIGAIGRFVTKKGFAPYLQSLAILQKEGVEFKAVLGGDGDLGEELKALAASLGIADRLSFTGWVEAKGEFYNAIDIFCLPSLHEPFGIVVLEAMSYGLPMVVTDSEGPLDFLENEGDALIVPKANPPAMAQALKRLISDRTYTDRLAEAGLSKLRSGFTHQAVGKRLSAALAQLKSEGRL